MIKLEHFKTTLTGHFILLATSNSIEKNAVNAILQGKKAIKIIPENLGCYIGLIDNQIIVHISGSSGTVAQDSIGRCIMEFVSDSAYPNPQMVIMNGFCWGNPTRVKSGDVIISNTIYSINSDVIKNGTREYKLKLYESPLVGNYLSETCKNGPIASLESLISETDYRDDIIAKYPAIYGGEMEGFGFIPTLKSRKIPWLIMKAVSDMADEQFTREHQLQAAEKAAGQIPHLLKELFADFEQEQASSEIQHLKNLLKGDDLKIDRSEFTADSLTDYLNNTIGPVIDSKLSEYFFEAGENEREFIDAFCDVILEIIQNSFRHAGSSVFEIGFRAKAIILKDNGIDYHLSDITGDRGGATAWRRIDELFLSKQKVNYVHSSQNTHKFQLEEVKDILRNIREKCSIRINPGTISREQTRHEILNYDPACTALYLKASETRMSSRLLTIIEQAKIILEKGLTIYISVDNSFRAKQYRDALSDYSERVIILQE